MTSAAWSTMSEGAHPSDDKDIEMVFDFPYLSDDAAVGFLNEHGRVFFIVRGLPGTGKSVLSTMLGDRYPEHKVYWADKMFMSPVPVQRTDITLKESHRLCYEKMEGFMKKNVPVIINRNSNVRVSEMSKYLRLAVKYGYTIILADTSYRFVISPQELVATNNKGLSLAYMEKRCSQWQKVYPIYTGWFFSPKTVLLLLRHFSSIWSLLSREDWRPPKILYQEGQPFCLGKRCWFGKASSQKEYCDSKEVKDAYGKVDTIRVVGYAVIESFALAVVALDEGQAKLSGHSDAKESDESLSELFSQLSISGWQRTSCEVQPGDIVDDEDEEEDCLLQSDQVEDITTKDSVSFIILGSCLASPELPLVASKRLPELWKSLCQSMCISESGVKCKDKVAVDDVIAYRAQEDFLILGFGLELCGVFTGCYQPYDSKVQQPCKYFLRTGRCKFGDSCLYMHQR